MTRAVPTDYRTPTSEAAPPAVRFEAWPASVRPSPWTLAALLSVFLLPVSLVPSTYGFMFRIPPLPIAWWTDYLVLIFAGVYRSCISRSCING